MLGWGEWKVSRFLSQAMAQIEKETLRMLKQRDPWLELTWQDFVDFEYLAGNDILDYHRGKRTSIGGCIAAMAVCSRHWPRGCRSPMRRR